MQGSWKCFHLSSSVRALRYASPLPLRYVCLLCLRTLQAGAATDSTHLSCLISWQSWEAANTHEGASFDPGPTYRSTPPHPHRPAYAPCLWSAWRSRRSSAPHTPPFWSISIWPHYYYFCQKVLKRFLGSGLFVRAFARAGTEAAEWPTTVLCLLHGSHSCLFFLSCASCLLVVVGGLTRPWGNLSFDLWLEERRDGLCSQERETHSIHSKWATLLPRLAPFWALWWLRVNITFRDNFGGEN